MRNFEVLATSGTFGVLGEAAQVTERGELLILDEEGRAIAAFSSGGWGYCTSTLAPMMASGRPKPALVAEGDRKR